MYCPLGPAMLAESCEDSQYANSKISFTRQQARAVLLGLIQFAGSRTITSGFWRSARPSQQSGSANLLSPCAGFTALFLGTRPLHHQGNALQFPLEDFQRATHHADPAHCVASGLSR